MKKKNNKKLARNAIRARKAVKKRENEQNTSKQRKRIATRIASLLGCLLLVSALSLPCFAYVQAPEQPPDFTPPTINYLEVFYDYYSLNGTPLYYYMNSTYFDQNLPYLFYFNAQTVGNQVFLDEPLTFNTFDDLSLAKLMIYDNTTGYSYFTLDGYWSSSYTTSGNNRIYRLYFNEITDGDVEQSLSIVTKYDRTTLEVLESTVSSTRYGLTGSSDRYTFVSSCDPVSSVPLSTLSRFGFIDTILEVNYDTFVDGCNCGLYSGYTQGVEQARPIGYYEGYYDGYEAGEVNGNSAGQKEAYDRGYQAGLVASDAYQQGYDDATQDIDSGEWGKNFLSDIFNAPMHAMNEFIIASWTTANGTLIEIPLGALLGAVIGFLILMWFLKMFAGG